MDILFQPKVEGLEALQGGSSLDLGAGTTEMDTVVEGYVKTHKACESLVPGLFLRPGTECLV